MATFLEYKLDALLASWLFFFFALLRVRASFPKCDIITKNSCSLRLDIVTTTATPALTTEPVEIGWEHSELIHYLHRNCFCDELCEVLDDCCDDYRDTRDAESRGSIYGTRLGMYKKHMDYSPLINMFDYYTAGQSKREGIIGTSWIQTCPQYFQSGKQRTLCEDLDNYDRLLWWPVSNLKTGITYRNMYCALCWGDKETVFWEISVGCSYRSGGGDYYNSLMGDPLMADDYYENSRTKRSDKTNNGTEPTYSEDEPSHTEATPSSGTTERPDILVKLERCQKYLLNPFGVRNLRNYQLTIISDCPSNWTDKTVADLCRNYTYIIYDNSTNNLFYKNVHCAMCNGVKAGNVVCDWADEDAAVMGLGFASSTQPFYPITVLFEPQGSKVTVTDEGSVKSNVLEYCGKNHIFDMYQQKCRRVFCPPRQDYVNGSCVRTSSLRMSYRPRTLDTNLSAPPPRKCPEIMIRPEEFRILENGNVILNGSEREINSTNVRQVNDSLFLCAHHVFDNNRSVAMVRTFYKFEDAAMIISVSGQIFSIICLALNFIIYAILPPLRNTPGKTLMSLVLALFFSQLTFLVGAGRTKNFITCVLAATLIHYFILASFVWMNALSLDLALAFAPTNLHSSDEKTKRRRFVGFSLYGWVSPLLVVGISLSLDLLGDDAGEFTPHYGRHICWISNPSAVGLLFVLPLALLLTVNIILYIFTAVNIYKATVAAEMVRKRDKRSLLLYIKLSVIMGGTWIFAFIWILTKSSVVQYMFIILNSLQGAFIFFSFVFRRKVYHMLKQYYGKERKRSTSSTGKAATYSVTTPTETNNKVCAVRQESLATAV